MVGERSQTLKGIGLLLLSLLCFDMMTVFVRTLSADYQPTELSAYRNIFGMIPSFVVLYFGGELRFNRQALYIDQWRLALLRGFVVAVAQLCLYTSLGFMELAAVSALAQTNGMFVVLFSVLFLSERVGLWRWGALGLGFGGAMWILKPGSDAFTLFSILPCAAAACYAFSMVTVRKFDKSISSAILYLYSGTAAAIGAVALTLSAGGFSEIASLRDAALILAMSLFGGCGVLLMMFAYRAVAPSILAPFGYFSLLTAFLLGWVFFDEAPIDKLFPGAFLIIAAGITIIWRERQAKAS